jgi:N-acetylglucosaminyldiphosphoundecaprenol N-acetyl-beta-D-mannosaminyltransferase
MSQASLPSAKVLDLGVTLLTMEEWTGKVAESIQTGERCIIMSQNLHSVYLAHRVKALKQAQDIALMRIDGMSVVALARLTGVRARRDHRLTWNDWFHPLFLEAETRGWTIFNVGSTPTISEQIKEVVRQKYPRLRFAAHHGYFDRTPDGAENRAILDTINAFNPDILMVGMGMPNQELWVAANRSALTCRVILTCGAAIEYVTGHQPTAPRWMASIGLEWLHRLAANPRRLWSRYLVEPWYVAWLLVQSSCRRFAKPF